MEFIDKFNTDLWTTTDIEKHKGFVLYTIVKPQLFKPGQFKYAVREVRDDDEDCEFNMVLLDGACGKMDPLANIRNCEMLVKDGNVVAVNLDGDCVIKKDLVA